MNLKQQEKEHEGDREGGSSLDSEGSTGSEGYRPEDFDQGKIEQKQH